MMAMCCAHALHERGLVSHNPSIPNRTLDTKIPELGKARAELPVNSCGYGSVPSGTKNWERCTTTICTHSSLAPPDLFACTRTIAAQGAGTPKIPHRG